MINSFDKSSGFMYLILFIFYASSTIDVMLYFRWLSTSIYAILQYCCGCGSGHGAAPGASPYCHRRLIGTQGGNSITESLATSERTRPGQYLRIL